MQPYVAASFLIACCFSLVAGCNAQIAQIMQPCPIKGEDVTCPDTSIKFSVFSGKTRERRALGDSVEDESWFTNGTQFDPELPTVLLVHGFSREIGTEVLRSAYLRRGGYNVLEVDWTPLTQLHCYVQAVSSVNGVAKCTGAMLEVLQNASGVPAENVTCVGHSLGAHVCGVTSKYMPAKFNKIVALDPARPLMQFRLAAERLDAKDANSVQVIHTSAGYYGLPGMQGTADFCVNNGAQPYCQRNIAVHLCSHFQAICLYAESLDPARSRSAVPCVRACPQLLNSYLPGETAVVGEHMNSSAEGMYCMSISEAPYCRHYAPNDDPYYGDLRCCP